MTGGFAIGPNSCGFCGGDYGEHFGKCPAAPSSLNFPFPLSPVIDTSEELLELAEIVASLACGMDLEKARAQKIINSLRKKLEI